MQNKNNLARLENVLNAETIKKGDIMRKVKIDIPNLYLTEEQKDEINKNGVELAEKFSQRLHQNDKELEYKISRDDTIYK